MKKLFTISLVIYTVSIGLLILLTVFIKFSSFNKDYYPPSFIMFLTFLTVTFISLVAFLVLKKRESLTKQIIKYLLVILIIVGLTIQIVWLIDLFKESVSSTEDKIALSLYFFLMLLGICSLPALFDKTQPKSVN